MMRSLGGGGTNDALATRDKKKVSDLLKLVDSLKVQLKDSEEAMRRYQTLNKHSSMVISTNPNAQPASLREQSVKVQALEAKNNEMMSNYNALRSQLKACQTENSQLIIELKEAKEKANKLSRDNRSLELSV